MAKQKSERRPRFGEHFRPGTSLAKQLDGKEDYSTWDDEEVFRGRKRSKSGGFAGRPPKVVTHGLELERAKRGYKTSLEKLKVALPSGIAGLEYVVRRWIGSDDPQKVKIAVEAAKHLTALGIPAQLMVQVSKDEAAQGLSAFERHIEAMMGNSIREDRRRTLERIYEAAMASGADPRKLLDNLERQEAEAEAEEAARLARGERIKVSTRLSRTVEGRSRVLDDSEPGDD